MSISLLALLIATLILSSLVYYLFVINSRLLQNQESLQKNLSESNFKEVSLQSTVDMLTTSINEVVADNEKLKEELKRTFHQKKSSEVRVGLITEQLAPFLEGFPYDPSNCHFLGKPVDIVCFDDTGIHFIEVKSGTSSLSLSQRKIKNHIKEGNVSFEIYRIKGDKS